MSIALIFWILMLVWLAFGLMGSRIGPWAPYGSTLLLFILLLLLGWGIFGQPVHA